ncbi:hypothetical protein GUITHDRAFT_152194 [Guillardia theta CCMP2712]|uniref:PPM-type phosphatase domain-containing protein n=2 Tax=Guillardia theta TaxID=55529 RepID=L1JF98_GUITC|nr:hypothetical protein GUITHDRAFT_152194 [Guillardia theta CCMP2712]EKX47218.1 hypothetical protein GUITHDRAFT_152194 [Guillardia theta CCMP2712]|eukprot:XP_005834198.1 hypothetical protein GUITHDRAFT_152194 [Guillardia theta CCMP2712]
MLRVVVFAVGVASVSGFSSPIALRHAAPQAKLSCSPRRGRAQTPSVRMGLFDNFVKAFETSIPGNSADLNQYEGWIERDGMKAFSFDGKQAPRPISYGSYSLAGRTAASNTAMRESSKAQNNPFAGLPKWMQSPVASSKAPVSNKENQDGVLQIPDVGDGVSMFCVFDGHGEYGKLVTDWAIRTLPSYIAGAVAEGRPGQLLNRITDAYRAADALLTEELGYPVIEDSGTTCALALVKDDLLLVGGLGDSRVVLGVDTGDGSLGAQPVTLDQSPKVPAETARIEKAGGEVRGEGVGGRVYAKGQEFPGLAVARAFGDGDAKQYGVTVDPQFIGWKLRSGQDFVLILASDGVWNAVGNEIAVEICAKHRQTRDANKAANELVLKARQVWEGLAKGRIDDISAVVVFL